jgi:hypothetical protein
MQEYLQGAKTTRFCWTADHLFQDISATDAFDGAFLDISVAVTVAITRRDVSILDYEEPPSFLTRGGSGCMNCRIRAVNRRIESLPGHPRVS